MSSPGLPLARDIILESLVDGLFEVNHAGGQIDHGHPAISAELFSIAERDVVAAAQKLETEPPLHLSTAGLQAPVAIWQLIYQQFIQLERCRQHCLFYARLFLDLPEDGPSRRLAWLYPSLRQLPSAGMIFSLERQYVA